MQRQTQEMRNRLFELRIKTPHEKQATEKPVQQDWEFQPLKEFKFPEQKPDKPQQKENE